MYHINNMYLYFFVGKKLIVNFYKKYMVNIDKYIDRQYIHYKLCIFI